MVFGKKKKQQQYEEARSDDEENDVSYQGQEAEEEEEPQEEEEEEGTSTNVRRGNQRAGKHDQEEEEEEEEPTGEGEEEEGEEGEEGQEEDEEEDDGGRSRGIPADHEVDIPHRDDYPMSHDAGNEDKHEAGAIFAAHLLAALANSYVQSESQHATHEHVQTETVDGHEQDSDYRHIKVTLPDHYGRSHEWDVLIDTGADENFMSQSAVEMLGLQVDQSEGPANVTVGSGDTADILGNTTFPFYAGNPIKKYTQQFYVMAELPQNMILGDPFVKNSHALVLSPEFGGPQPVNNKGDLLIMGIKPPAPVPGQATALKKEAAQHKAEKDAYRQKKASSKAPVASTRAVRR